MAGNRIWRTVEDGIHLDSLFAETNDILIANNTLWECGLALRLWDSAIKGANIRFQNNLVLGAPQADIVFIDSGGDPSEPRGPGNVIALAQAWQCDHNWREVKPPAEPATLPDLGPGKPKFKLPQGGGCAGSFS